MGEKGLLMRFWRIAAFLALVGLGAVITAMRIQNAWNNRPLVIKLVVPPAFAVPRDFDFGRYRLSWLGHGFSIHAQGQPAQVLWAVQGGFVGAGNGHRREREGYWQSRLVERRDLLCLEQSLESFERQGDRLILRGHLRCGNGTVSPYRVTFSDDHWQGVRLSVEVTDSRLNRLYLSWSRELGERFLEPAKVVSRADAADGRAVFAEPGEGGRDAGCLVSTLRTFCTASESFQWIDLVSQTDVRLEVRDRQLVAYLSSNAGRAMPLHQVPK